MLETDENKRERAEESTRSSRRKPDEKPVYSQYSQIRFDIYDIFHRYTEDYGALYGLQDINRDGSKEYKRTKGAAIALAVQFYAKVSNQFPATMAALIAKDEAVNGKEYVEKYGDIVANYYELMSRITNGVIVDEKKGRQGKYSPNLRELSFITNFMSRFMHESGIGAIEGRFQDEKNEFGYGG